MKLADLGRLAESVYFQDHRDEDYEDTLTTVRHALSKDHLSLSKLVIKQYEYEKENFTRQELYELFRAVQLQLGADQLDSLFRNLDPDYNGVILVGNLTKAVGGSMAESRLSIQSNQSKFWLEELAGKLRATGPYQTLQYFDEDSDGILSLQELMHYIESVDLSIERRIISKVFFAKADGVAINEILAGLGIRPEEQFIEASVDSVNCSLVELSQSFIIDKHEENKIKIKEVGRVSMNVIDPYRNPYTEVQEPLLSLAYKYINSRRLFIDQHNPRPKMGLLYKHARQIFGLTYFLFEVQRSIIRLGIGTILDSRNIIQGKGKDCYFLSAAAGVVEHYPQFIYRLFILDKNPSDIYGIRLFIDGEWKTTIVDAQLPVDERGILYYAKPFRSEIWVLLLEKAWAKIYGSYDNIEGGNPEEGLTALTGAPCLKMVGDDPMIVEKLRHYIQQNYIVTANTSELVNKMDKADQKTKGIYENHAYTVVGLFQNLTWKREGRIEQITLVKIRNPWGRGIWKGDWSFDCPLWTRELRQKLNYTKDPKNGSFFMNVPDFLLMFGTMKVCLLSPVNQNSSLRMSSRKKEFVFAKISVKEQGMYFLSIFQEGTRNFKVEPTKAKHASISHIFVANVSSNGFFFPTSSKTNNRDKTHMEVWLAVGEHVVFSRLKWTHAEQSQFVLGCYGPSQVIMQPIDPQPKYVYDYIQAKSLEEKGEKLSYFAQDRPESLRTIHISNEDGYGHITYTNNSYQHMKVELRLNECRGIKAVPPGALPLVVAIPPKTRYTLCLLVEPKVKYTLQQAVQFV